MCLCHHTLHITSQNTKSKLFGESHNILIIFNNQSNKYYILIKTRKHFTMILHWIVFLSLPPQSTFPTSMLVLFMLRCSLAQQSYSSGENGQLVCIILASNWNGTDKTTACQQISSWKKNVITNCGPTEDMGLGANLLLSLGTICPACYWCGTTPNPQSCVLQTQEAADWAGAHHTNWARQLPAAAAHGHHNADQSAEQPLDHSTPQVLWPCTTPLNSFL